MRSHTLEIWKLSWICKKATLAFKILFYSWPKYAETRFFFFFSSKAIKFWKNRRQGIQLLTAWPDDGIKSSQSFLKIVQKVAFTVLTVKPRVSLT